MADNRAISANAYSKYSEIFKLLNQKEANYIIEGKDLLIKELHKLHKKSKAKLSENIILELDGLINLANMKLPDDAQLQIANGTWNEIKGLQDQALRIYEMVRERHQVDHEGAYLYAADILIYQKKFNEANTLLNEFLRLEITRPVPPSQKSIKDAHHLQDRAKEAEHNLEASLSEATAFGFSKKQPMHVFFAELAKKNIAEKAKKIIKKVEYKPKSLSKNQS